MSYFNVNIMFGNPTKQKSKIIHHAQKL